MPNINWMSLVLGMILLYGFQYFMAARGRSTGK